MLQGYPRTRAELSSWYPVENFDGDFKIIIKRVSKNRQKTIRQNSSTGVISKGDVLHIAKLARLELTEAEVEKLQKELSSILDYFALLQEVPSLVNVAEGIHAGIEATRPDLARDTNEGFAKALLAAAPNTKDGYIKVKQILN